MIFDPERILLGGGLTDVGPPLRDGVAAWLDRLVLGAEHRPAVEVVIAELGDDAGALGAPCGPTGATPETQTGGGRPAGG